MNFSVLILAGGTSSRMGCDKAFLQVDGRLLIERQIELVRSLSPDEVFISGRPEQDFSKYSCRVLNDDFPAAGPLAGIERGLAVAASPLLLVLAVDLPRMKAHFVVSLVKASSPTTGVIPEVNAHLEPLVALYPKSAHALALSQLKAGRPAVRDFALVCEEAGILRRHRVTESERPLLLNWNTPKDFSGNRDSEVV